MQCRRIIAITQIGDLSPELRAGYADHPGTDDDPVYQLISLKEHPAEIRKAKHLELFGRTPVISSANLEVGFKMLENAIYAVANNYISIDTFLKKPDPNPDFSFTISYQDPSGFPTLQEFAEVLPEVGQLCVQVMGVPQRAACVEIKLSDLYETVRRRSGNLFGPN